jgi:hypothetical protein
MLHTLVASIAFLHAGAPITPRAVTPPEGPAPAFVVVRSVDSAKGQLIYTQTVVVHVAVPVHRFVEDGGAKKVVTDTVLVPRTETREAVLDVKSGKMATGENKPLTTDEALKVLTPGSALVIFPAGLKVDPAYLKVLKPEAVVFMPKP